MEREQDTHVGCGGHSHSGCGGGHHHHGAEGLSEGRIKASLLLTFSFVIVEAIVGWRANSLALVSDAGHNFTDGLALALSWYAIWIARKPATPTKTYGYHRVGILTALFNAVTLLAIAGFIFSEAYHLFRSPQSVAPLPMIAVASVAFVMNTVIALALRRDAAQSVNMRAAFIHMAGDALSSLGVVVAGLLIRATGWSYADPLVSVLIGLFIVYSSWGIIVETVNILLEGTPRGMDVTAVAGAMRTVPGVVDVHDLHVWTISDGMIALSCHLRVGQTDVYAAQHVVQLVKSLLDTEYGVSHSTIETECGGECDHPQLLCSLPGDNGNSASDDASLNSFRVTALRSEPTS